LHRQVFGGEPLGKSPVERQNWEDNTKMNLRGTEFGDPRLDSNISVWNSLMFHWFAILYVFYKLLIE
jgi:hypothetical protein